MRVVFIMSGQRRGKCPPPRPRADPSSAIAIICQARFALGIMAQSAFERRKVTVLGRENPSVSGSVPPSKALLDHAVGEAQAYVQGESLKAGAAP